MMNNLLVVPEAENMLRQYKEEVAQEFGIYHSAQEIDAISKSMTKRLVDQTKQADKRC